MVSADYHDVPKVKKYKPRQIIPKSLTNLNGNKLFYHSAIAVNGPVRIAADPGRPI